MDTIEIWKICTVVFYQKQEFCKKGIQPEACNFIEKETLAQVFSCEFCKTSTNHISYKTPPVTASVLSQLALVVRKYLRIQCKVISLENKINYFLLKTWNHLRFVTPFFQEGHWDEQTWRTDKKMPVMKHTITRKAIGFMFLRLNCSDISQRI